jgi:hypothetical protein
MNNFLYKLITVTIFFFSVSMFISCKQSERQKIDDKIKEWTNKKIKIPDNLSYSVYIKDTATVNIKNSAFKIVTYIDLKECSVCRLNLPSWKSFIEEMNSLSQNKIPVLLFIHTKDIMKLRYDLRSNVFNYPVCVDTDDLLNKTNKLDKDERFRTFLLNKDDKIIAIGNPATNEQIKKYYFQIIANQHPSKYSTKKEESIIIPHTIDLGEFDWNKIIKKSFDLVNNSNDTVFFNDIYSSCECVRLSKTKLILLPNSRKTMTFTFKAEKAEGSFYREIILNDNNKKEYVINILGISD